MTEYDVKEKLLECEMIKKIVSSPVRRIIFLKLYDQDLSFKELCEKTSLQPNIVLEEVLSLKRIGVVEEYRTDMIGPLEEVIHYGLTGKAKKLIPYIRDYHSRFENLDLTKVITESLGKIKLSTSR